MKDIMKAGMYGLIVGDALGVPVEFLDRNVLQNNPVTGMRAYGTHHQPAGTWSDDSSMALATLDSINKENGINPEKIMENFANWSLHSAYTPFNEVFDMGIATHSAIIKYAQGIEAIKCGGTGEYDNGNGSLMRILPACIYLWDRAKKICTSDDEGIYMIHSVSALTHAHIRSQMACGIYYFLVKSILNESGSLISRLQVGIDKALAYYRRDLRNNKELGHYERLIDLKEFALTDEDKIKSSGYVVDTLEAAIWSLITTDSYKDAVLRSVNLGNDTDTVGAVAGGLAGLYYGFDAIPSEWMDELKGRVILKEIIGE